MVHSHGDFFGSIAFPAVAELALRVNKLGKSSVTYEVALFERGVEEVKSVGEFIQLVLPPPFQFCFISSQELFAIQSWFRKTLLIARRYRSFLTNTVSSSTEILDDRQ